MTLVADRRGCSALTLKRARLAAADTVGGDELERHLAFQRLVTRVIDNAHAPAPSDVEYDMIGERRAQGQLSHSPLSSRARPLDAMDLSAWEYQTIWSNEHRSSVERRGPGRHVRR